MKKGIHPEYYEMVVKCACGNEIPAKSTSESINIAICSGCHPFFTGQQKFIDTAGRVEKFKNRFGDITLKGK